MQTATMQDAPEAPLLAAGHAGGSTEKAAGTPYALHPAQGRAATAARTRSRWRADRGPARGARTVGSSD